jgi:hypothetical protein
MAEGRLFFAPLGSGIGDVVIAMPAFAWLTANSDREVWLVARGPRQLGFEKRIPNLAGVIREVDLQGVLSDADTYINLRAHKLQTDYNWYGATFERDYPGFLVNDIMNEICVSQGIHADFSRFPRMQSTKIEGLQRTVAIVPGTTSNFKSWPAEHWLKLCEHIRRVESLDLLMLGEASTDPDRSPVVAQLKQAGILHYETPEIAEAIDVLSSVAAVVSVDTGLMHIAVQQGTPTVALFNSVHTYLRPVEHCRPIFAPQCAVECQFPEPDGSAFPVEYKEWVWWEGVFNYCKAATPCMTGVSVDAVAAKLGEALASRRLAQS